MLCFHGTEATFGYHGGMHPDYRESLIAHLAEIDQMIREAEELTTVPADDVLRDASKVLADLKE